MKAAVVEEPAWLRSPRVYFAKDSESGMCLRVTLLSNEPSWLVFEVCGARGFVRCSMCRPGSVLPVVSVKLFAVEELGVWPRPRFCAHWVPRCAKLCPSAVHFPF
jgi:hypothetical protein